MGDYKVGQTVQSQDGRHGIIRFIGTASFATGEWVGLELPDGSGKNDGSVKGERYFECKPAHGIFIRKEAIVQIIQQPLPTTNGRTATKPANGAATRPRPTSGVSADVARKRQSLMSSGSGPGSRLSIRSPTKSPTKMAHSSASSATSTPRTGTPATTARISGSSTKSRLSTTGRPSMAPPAAVRTAAHASRPSIGGVPPKTVRQPVASQPRHPQGGSQLQVRPKVSKEEEASVSKFADMEELPASPKVTEEEDKNLYSDDHRDTSDEDRSEAPSAPFAEGYEPSATAEPIPPVMAVSRSATNGSLESQAAKQREIESLKAKLRTMEKKRQEDRAKIGSVEVLQSERDRFESIIQVLQKKLKSAQLDNSELRDKYNEAEARAKQVDNTSAEHESEIELATLDKEMAEERAENFQAELEALKLKHEELELEAEILREENREMGSVMSPEEKASAGWLQMERERERLRQALVMLRDMSQQTESDLRDQVKELQDDLSEAEQLKSKFQGTSEKLSRLEATNKHLMEQLEAAESNEDVSMALEHEKEANLRQIAQLTEQLQNLQEEVQVNDELESYHISAEKELQRQLDEAQALLYEKHHQTSEQDQVIEDLEYHLTKFRDVIAGLQSDIDDLRRSKDITEIEAHEMSSKSRAMMDLNLQLQNSAAKTQLKTIDVEMSRIRAEESTQHLAIVQMFVPDLYEGEKNPVLALLCVRRIQSKAALINSLLRDRVRDRPHLLQDEPFIVFDVMEKLGWIGSCCDRFVQFTNSCGVTDFSRLNQVVYELEPVERTMNGWIEALRRDEMGKDDPEHLSRMMGILSDLAEKLIPESLGAKGAELFARVAMTENYSDNTASQIGILVKAVQSRLGHPTDENEESSHFDKKMDQLSTKARTIKYVAGKVLQGLDELRSRSMCPGELTWGLFEEGEMLAKELSKMTRGVGIAVLDDIAKDEHDRPLTYTSVLDVMTKFLSTFLQQPPTPKDGQTDDAFVLLAAKLQTLHSRVGEMLLKTQDLTAASELEKAPPPWLVRAKEIKSQKVISQDVQEELTRLQTRAQEQLVAITGKDRTLEEQQIKIELLESRTKETKSQVEALHRLEAEVRQLQAEKEKAELGFEETKMEHESLRQKHEEASFELANLQKAHRAGGASSLAATDQTAVLHLSADNRQLRLEIESLQVAVRWLKFELHRAKIPMSAASLTAESHAWLDPVNLRQTRRKRPEARSLEDRDKEWVKRDTNEVFDRLLDVARGLKPVVLKDPADISGEGEKGDSADGIGRRKMTSWRPMRDSPKYQVLKQRETVERWVEERDELVRRVHMTNHSGSGRDRARPRPDDRKQVNFAYSLGDAGLMEEDWKSNLGAEAAGVQIVSLSP